MGIRAKITEALKSKEITKYRLSKLSGLPYTSIHEFLNGRLKNPSFESVVKIANALEIPLNELADCENDS